MLQSLTTNYTYIAAHSVGNEITSCSLRKICITFVRNLQTYIYILYVCVCVCVHTHTHTHTHTSYIHTHVQDALQTKGTDMTQLLHTVHNILHKSITNAVLLVSRANAVIWHGFLLYLSDHGLLLLLFQMLVHCFQVEHWTALHHVTLIHQQQTQWYYSSV